MHDRQRETIKTAEEQQKEEMRKSRPEASLATHVKKNKGMRSEDK